MPNSRVVVHQRDTDLTAGRIEQAELMLSAALDVTAKFVPSARTVAPSG